jgi:hypothetical protein
MKDLYQEIKKAIIELLVIQLVLVLIVYSAISLKESRNRHEITYSAKCVSGKIQLADVKMSPEFLLHETSYCE